MAGTPIPLTNITIGHVKTLSIVLLVVVAGGAALGATLLTASSVVGVIVVMVTVFGALLVVPWWYRKQKSARVKTHIIERGDDPVSGIREYYAEHDNLSLAIRSEINTVIPVMCDLGMTGHALRLCPEENQHHVVPMTVPFEAQPLNEADPNFSDIAGLDHDADEDAGWKRIKRNVRIKGGWWVVAMFGFNVVIYSFESYRAGRITNNLILWSVLLLITLFGAGKGFATLTSWFAVPGGVFISKGSWRGRPRRLLRFTRADSVLVVYKFNRLQWVANVGRDANVLRVTLTAQEVQFLLQAWFSPLVPPDVEDVESLI